MPSESANPTKQARFDTVAVRGGEQRKNGHDAVTVPIVCTATYAFNDTQEIRDHFEGRVEREEYGRYGNPTVRAAERKLAALEAAEDAILFDSGMSAITSTLWAMLKPGDHIVLTSDCYRRTRQFVKTVLARYGVESSFVEPSDYQGIERAIVDGKTRLLLTESPTNPYLHVVDVARLASIVKKRRRLKLVIDSTLATPVNQRPLGQGADLVVHSCTKYIAGHNDLLAGGVCGAQPLIDALREFRGMAGGILDPHAAYLLLRGAKTLALRVERQNDSALGIARFLERHPSVERVYYPGLESHPDHAIAQSQMRGFGGMVSFLVKGDLDTCSRFIDACRVPSVGPSMGGVESLIEQTALMSFYELSTEERLAVGIQNNLVRLSVGIEHPDDLIEDLDQALRRATQ
jgi:cystathionine gamma-synthase